MATRTQRAFREESLFERLEDGETAFADLVRPDYGSMVSMLTGAMMAGLTLLAATLAANNAEDPIIGQGLFVAGGLFVAYTLVRVGRGLRSLWDRRFHKPTPVRLESTGLAQVDDSGTLSTLSWEDIRVVQHRRLAHLVRGRDKKQQIEISKRLSDHEGLSAFIKFAFLLRQEASGEWQGLLAETRTRLQGPGFHFHCDGKRTRAIHIDAKGLAFVDGSGGEQRMDWDLLKESIFEPTKSMLRFKHPGSQTVLCLPRGTEADLLIDQFIRWGLHTEPSFA